MENVVLAYTAGIMDGEGYLGITCHAYYNAVRYVPRMSITNTDFDLIQWLMDNFGGTYSVNRKNASKYCYMWHIFETDKLCEFLEDIKPFVKLKHRQLELLLYFFSLGTGKPGTRIDPDLQMTRADLFFDMQLLNHKEMREV